jgi:uncharacterized protein with ParB-like and HNH nuclease domain
MSKYSSTTIIDAMDSIAINEFLLPAIQRKFTWGPNQIELLFDSIMRNYPINSFMLWKITDKSIKHNYRFYTFLQDYCEKFGEENPDAPTPFLKDEFFAVIDGQQRLTSIYIGLNGTYRYKRPSKWWINCEDNLPTRRLYLNLKGPVVTEIDNAKQYNFSFLSKDDLALYEDNPDYLWFKVGEILRFKEINDVFIYLSERGLVTNKFATSTLSTLWNKIHIEDLINYCTITDQNQDKVLEVFIRTNSGGTQLTFSDLLMSISSANWEKHDARQEIAYTKEIIFTLGNPNFNISQDFILKTILVLESDDIRFQLDNFSKKNVKFFETKWEKIKEALISSFKLLDALGYSDSSLRAKNAVIPIAYYIYKNQLSGTILAPSHYREEKTKIIKWLNISIIKGIFGGQSDGVLKKIRDIIKNEPTTSFPFDTIIQAFSSDPNKNYSMDDVFIESLLTEQWQSPIGTLVLQLLYSDQVYQYGKSVAQDHMHPKTVFENKMKIEKYALSNEQIEFFTNPENYNSILNLQLISSSANSSKLDTPLEDWAKTHKIQKADLFVHPETSLGFSDFERFIQARKEKLTERLKTILE